METNDYIAEKQRIEREKNEDYSDAPKSNQEVRQKTAAQDVLITKIMKSKKILDKEYRMFRSILDNKVISTYDAAVFIEHVLSLLKFRRTFLNGKHKAYKQCYYCKSRDDVDRYLDLDTEKSFWCCETCALNLNQVRVVLTKYGEISTKESLNGERDPFEIAANMMVEDKKKGYTMSLCHATVPENFKESKEAQADLYKKYDYPAEQEDIDDDARHGDLE